MSGLNPREDREKAQQRKVAMVASGSRRVLWNCNGRTLDQQLQEDVLAEYLECVRTEAGEELPDKERCLVSRRKEVASKMVVWSKGGDCPKYWRRADRGLWW